MSVIAGFPTEEVSEEEVVSRQVFAISRLTPAMMTANIVNAFATILVLQITGQNLAVAVIWAIVVVVFALYFIWQWYSRRGNPFPAKLKKRTRKKVVVFAAVLGCLWAFPGIVLVPNTSGAAQAFLIALAAGMVSGGAISLYPIPNAAIAFSGIIAGGNLTGFALTGQPVFFGFALVAVAFFYVIVRSVARHEQIFVSEFRNRRELDNKNKIIERLLEETRAGALEEKLEAEAKLAQAQKMEAVGRLTAGVAHDFNNLLAVIMGNLELIDLIYDDPGAKELIGEALGATQRGADLTGQLLAYGRRASLIPEVVDPNAVVQKMGNLFRRTLGANIQIETTFASENWRIEVDCSQLENALLNLAINARDAMPEGGILTLQTTSVHFTEPYQQDPLTEVEPGRYVLVSVTDTGSGILPENLFQVFEPFFSTKPMGEGSGLGLAMVYGFAIQSGGSVQIDSEPGRETIVKLYFPAVGGTDPVPDQKKPDVTELVAGSETVLVVDDNREVLTAVSRQLEKLGFTVLEAQDGASAISILDKNQAVDLLLTDIAMPGQVQGQELAKLAKAKMPDLKIVFMSGYPNGMFGKESGATKDAQMLTKPIQMAKLSAAVRRALDGKERADQR